MFRRRHTKNVSAQQSLRKKQLAEFKTIHPLAASNQNETIFEVPVSVRGGHLRLRVTLPSDFPERKPKVVCLSTVRHRMVDSNMEVVGHPKLQSWGSYNSLGRIVKEIIDDFQRNPPVFITNPTPQGVGRPAPSARLPMARAVPVAGRHQQTVQIARPVNGGGGGGVARAGGAGFGEAKTAMRESEILYKPEVPDTRFLMLDGYNTQELSKLVSSEEQMDALVDSLGIFKVGDSKKEELYKTVEALAEKNLKQKPILSQLEKEVEELRKQKEAVKVKLDELIPRQKEILKNYTYEAVSKRLASAVNKADEASCDILQKFTDEELELDPFIKQYIKAKALYHKRMAKQERLSYTESKRAQLVDRLPSLPI